MAIEIVSFPIKNGGSFYSYVAVYQRVPKLPSSARHAGRCGGETGLGLGFAFGLGLGCHLRLHYLHGRTGVGQQLSQLAWGPAVGSTVAAIGWPGKPGKLQLVDLGLGGWFCSSLGGLLQVCDNYICIIYILHILLPGRSPHLNMSGAISLANSGVQLRATLSILGKTPFIQSNGFDSRKANCQWKIPAFSSNIIP